MLTLPSPCAMGVACRRRVGGARRTVLPAFHPLCCGFMGGGEGGGRGLCRSHNSSHRYQEGVAAFLGDTWSLQGVNARDRGFVWSYTVLPGAGLPYWAAIWVVLRQVLPHRVRVRARSPSPS